MFSKIVVKGSGIAPLYKTLTEAATPPGDVKWNFEKFLIGRDGTIKGRYKSGVGPDDAALKTAIEAELAKAPERNDIRNALANTSVRVGNYNKAIPEFLKLLASAPKDPSLVLRLAKVAKVVLQEELGRVLGDTGADVLVHVILLYLFDPALAVHRAIRDALRVLGTCGERGAMVSTGMQSGCPSCPY
jgi:hypothetical protein